MESSSPIFVQGLTDDCFSYDLNLSPLHGDNYYNQDEEQQFSFQNNQTLSQSISNIIVRWELDISGSLDAEFEPQLVYELGTILIPFPIRNELISAINNLVRRRPSVSNRVSIGVRAVISLYLDGEEEEEEEEEDQEAVEEEDQEEEEEDEEDNEFLDEMEMHRESLVTSSRTSSSRRRFVLVQLEMVKIEGDKEDRCAICLEEFITDSEAAKLPCSHVFHGDCVRIWLESRGTCPMCRSPLSVSTS